MSSDDVIDVNQWLRDWFNRRVEQTREHIDNYDLDRATVAHRISLTLTLLVALVVRLFPVLKGWDPTIKAFDPWMQLRAADYILEHGFWEFLLWWDTYSWYPYGRGIGNSLYIGIPLGIVLIYKILTFLGFNITLKLAAYLLPVIFGVITVYFTYLLGKELISARGGLFAALTMSVTPSFVSRSIAGFVDNEAVGVLFTIMSFYFFARAFLRNSNLSAILGGISLFMLGSSWGAFRLAYDLLPLFALVIVLTGNFSYRFLRAYITTVSVSTFLLILVPRVGPTFILDTEGIAPIGMIGFLILYGVLEDLSEDLNRDTFQRVILGGSVILLLIAVGVFAALLGFGIIDGIGSKFLSVLNPDFRSELPLIDSVSEHLPLSWGNLYSNISTLVFFMPLGIYYAMKNPNERNLFMLTFGLTTIYFSGSMVRLMLILAPAAAILSALAIDNLLLPYAYAAHGRIKLSKITMNLPSIGGGQAALSYLIVFGLIFIMLFNGVNAAEERFSAPELTPGNTPKDALTDWLQAFEWMRENTAYYQYTDDNNFAGLENGQPPVMLSWWDYGYYITGQGDTISLVDNATFNSTQIGTIGTMMMWNASASINLMYMYNIDHVLVVPSGGALQLGSDIGKSIWMIRISEKYTPEYGVVEEDYYDDNQYKSKYLDSVLWQLMAYHAPDMNDQSRSGRPPLISSGQRQGQDQLNRLVPNYRSEGEVNNLTYFKEVFRSTGISPDQAPGDYPFIRIFEVQYPDDIEMRVNNFQEKMKQIRSNQ